MTDYTHPDWWHDDDVTDEQRCRWYTEERNRRQVMRQIEAGAMPRTEHDMRRARRRGEARPGTVALSDYR